MAHRMGRKKEVRLPNPNRAATEEQNLQNKRLKSLYDAIDAGRNKDSIELADKLVRKFSGKDRNNLNDKVTVNTAQALKALALIRSENTAEAALLVENCEKALIGTEYSEGTLQILFHCFKESYMPNRIPLLIEKILKTQPPSKGLLLDLYTGYGRVMDFKNQQRVANMLYKDYENPKYLFWSINSVILQAVSSPALAQKMFYPLAQRMLEKLANEEGSDRKPSRTEIMLNYQVFTQQKEYQKALDYLDRVSGDGNLNTEDAKSMRFDLLKSAARFNELFDYIVDEVRTNPLNFGAWETLFWIYEHAAEKKDDVLKKRAIEQFDQLCKEHLSDSNSSSRHYAYLLKLLFFKHINNLGHTAQFDEFNSKFGTVLENLKQMILLTYERLNSFSDISKFLCLLTEAEQQELLNFMDIEFKGQFETINNVFLIRELLRTGFGFYRTNSASERNQYARKLVSDLNLVPSTDVNLDQHAKGVALIVTNLLWETYIETGSKQHLYELAALLEYIFARCQNVFIAALVLMRVYTVLGGISRIISLYNQLDIKFFQRDSLGYLTFASAMQFGRFREAIFYFTNLTTQFDHIERETSEAIVTANRVCSLDQIPHLVEFTEHCRASIYATGADILNQILSACFAVEQLQFGLITLRGDDERIDWSRVTDSRDFGILEQLALVDERVTAKAKKMGFEETLDYVKLMHAVGRVISDVGFSNLSQETFDANLAALRAHLSYCRSYYTTSEVSTYVQGFGVPQLVSLVSQPFLNPILDLLQLASRIFAIENSGDSVQAFKQLVQISTELSKEIKLDGLLNACRLGFESIAEFLERGTHFLVGMTLGAILIKFLEARVDALLPKLSRDLTLEKIEKAAVQKQDISDHMAALRVTSEPDPEVVDDAESMQSKRKSKKATSKPFDELNDEQKIAASFKIAHKNLLTTCREFELQTIKVNDQLKLIKTLFQDGTKESFKEANLDGFVDYVDRTLLESHTRTLNELRCYTERIQFISMLPRFNLLNVRFAGTAGLVTEK